MFSPAESAQINTLLILALGAAVSAFIAWCMKWKRQWDALETTIRTELPEIRENAHRAANGRAVRVDEAPDDAQGGI